MNRDRPVVIDASVAAKWVIEEEYWEQADALCAAMARARPPAVARLHSSARCSTLSSNGRAAKKQGYRMTEAPGKASDCGQVMS